MVSFPELFVGSGMTHGHWTRDAGYSTQEGPASPQDYEDHLNGVRGLGLVPVREDGTCVFGALDIDIDTIDHRALYAKVRARNIPLNVCRSKSGAAHCYVFFTQPYKAHTVVTLLKRWAGLLGYPNCEVFPKQTHIDKQNLGNWINLPFFGGEGSLRCGFGPDGPIGLTKFLETVKFYDPNDPVDDQLQTPKEELVQIMPPCLSKLTLQGIPEGARNQGMMNVGIFFRKAYPNGWEERFKEYNAKHCKPPLETKELHSVMKSVNKKKYQYMCDAEPICSRCNRAVCQTMQFGVNHMPWQEGGSFDEVSLNNLRKIDTKPPRYKLEVNSKDLEFSTDELRNYQTGFKKKIFEELNLVAAPMKQEFWDQQLISLMENITVIEAPPDASINGMILMKVYEFAALSERARKQEDILKGIPYYDKELTRVLFRSIDLQKYLQSARFTIENQILYQLLFAEGGQYKTLELKGKKVMVWSLPIVAGTMQTESFDLPKIEGVDASL